MPADDPMFREALAAMDKGDKARARDLFTRLLRTDQNNPLYWLYMSAVVETGKERVYCLKEALKRDPDNIAARRGLALAGALPDGEVPGPAPAARRNWQASLVTGNEKPPVPRGSQLVRLVAGVLVLAALVFVGLFGVRYLRTQQAAAQVNRLPTVVMTVEVKLSATPTVTRTPAGPTPTPGVTPLWMQLAATYTPTPIYVNTPHPRTEAYRSAMRAYGSSDWAEMLGYLQQVATQEPDAVDIDYLIGEAYRMQGKQAEAITAYTRALSKNPTFAPPHLGLARALMVDQPEAVMEAQANLEDAIRYDPGLAEAYLELANLHLQQEEAQAALDILEKGLPVLENTPWYYYYRARAAWLNEQPDAALEDARKANQLDMTMLEPYLLIGELLHAQGDLAASVEPLETYTRYVRDDPQALTLLGKAYLAQKSSLKALSVFERVLEINQGYVDVYILRGGLYLDGGEGQKAMDDFEDALRFKPDSFAANLGKGRAYMLLDYNGEAYMQLSRSEGFAETDSDKAQVLYWRAQSLEGLVQRDPNSAIAAVNDWKSLLALPEESYPAEWAAVAEKHMRALYTATPTLRSTLTATPTRAVITRTFTPTARPSQTPTRTLTPTLKPTATLTPTPTKKP